MKIIDRLLLSLFGAFSTFVSIVFSSMLLLDNIDKTIRFSIALIIALLIGVFLWYNSISVSKSLSSFILYGGLIIGTVGFLIGFVGPIIFNPSANQGPLFGIFISGPLGFLAGLITGGVYWKIKVKTS